MVTQLLDDITNATLHVCHYNSCLSKDLLSLLGGRIVASSNLMQLQIECTGKIQLKDYFETLDHLKKFDDRLVYYVQVNQRKYQIDITEPIDPPCHIPNRLAVKRNSISDGLSKAIDRETILQLKSGRRFETTMMLRNIPNKYTPSMLQQFIEKTHIDQYDFFYLRMDFKNKCNVGYAFINFLTPVGLGTFAELVQNKRWDHFNSEKVIATCFADIQGTEALIQKFRNSRYCFLKSVMMETEEYRPQLFYSEGPLKGQKRDFPKPESGRYRPKVDVLFSR
jgi:hypothetical protein